MPRVSRVSGSGGEPVAGSQRKPPEKAAASYVQICIEQLWWQKRTHVMLIPTGIFYLLLLVCIGAFIWVLWSRWK